jgi:hypothetical protein
VEPHLLLLAAEDFGASPSSPQQVCLAGVRNAEMVVLLLGARYGTPQQGSGLSPTHEEYREARGHRPVLVFVQSGIAREAEEEKFVEEVSGWEGGQYRDLFDSATSLRAVVTRQLHRWALSPQAVPVNEEELAARAVALLPQRSTYTTGSALLHVVVAGGPAQQVLRPSELDDPALHAAISRRHCSGSPPSSTVGKGCRRTSVG